MNFVVDTVIYSLLRQTAEPPFPRVTRGYEGNTEEKGGKEKEEEREDREKKPSKNHQKSYKKFLNVVLNKY